MLERVAGAITRYSMFPPGARIAVAVSGGADSVALLRALIELAPRWNATLSVAHVNHALRGADSDADAAFASELAAAHGLPFHLHPAPVAGLEGNLEQNARAARRSFFHGLIAAGAADRVALGHTRSDQAETVLFRFLRGSGGAGLSGIRAVTAEGLVRPLIDCTREQARSWLREIGQSWREDASNASLDFDRNRIRHETLPALAAAWNPQLEGTLAHTAEWARAEEEYWSGETARAASGLLRPCPGGGLVLDVRDLDRQPLALRRRIIRHALETLRGDLRSIDFEHVARILDLAAAAEGHGRLQVPGGDIFRSFEWLRMARPGEDGARGYEHPAPLGEPGLVLPDGARIWLEKKPRMPGSECRYNDSTERLDADRLSGPLEIRNWRPGDQYQPAGYADEQKIKQLFQQFRVPLWERRHWPVLTAGGSIVWSRRFGPSHLCAANPAARNVVEIVERRG